MKITIPSKKLTDKELLQIFPEAKAIIPDKIIEWLENKWAAEEIIRRKLTIVKNKSASENQWFWKDWIKFTDGADLLEINRQISRLRRLLLASINKELKGRITTEQIQQALVIPLERILGQPFRKIGNRLAALCPFHKEKTPSFCIYPKSNTYHCFGCQEHGDTINLVRKLHNYSFQEAVHYLNQQ